MEQFRYQFYLYDVGMPKALLGEFSNGCTMDMFEIEGYFLYILVQLTSRDQLSSNSLASRAVATIAN